MRNAILLPELVLIYSIYLLTMGPKVVALTPEIGSQSSQYRWIVYPNWGRSFIVAKNGNYEEFHSFIAVNKGFSIDP